MHIRPRFPQTSTGLHPRNVLTLKDHQLRKVFFFAKARPGQPRTPPSNGATSLSTSEPWPWSTVHLSHRSIWFNNLVLDNHELIGGFNPSEKYESQSGWMIPNIWKIKFMFQITNQRIFSFSSISLLYVPRAPCLPAKSRPSTGTRPCGRKGIFLMKAQQMGLPGLATKLLKMAMEIVDFPMNSMVDLSIVM